MLTLVQLYNLGLVENKDIFSGLTLPTGSPFNRTLIINSIIERCGLNFPLYADPTVMESAITLWSAKNQYTFEHLAKILKAEYSPIENKDYIEETTTTRDRAMTDNTVGTNSTTENVTNKFDEGLNEHVHQTSSRADQTATTTEEGSNQHVVEEHEGTDTTTNTTSAYNSSTYEPDNQSATLHGHKISTGTTTDQNSVENTSTNITGESSTGTTRDHNSITNGTKNTNVNLSNNKDIDEAENITVKTHQHGNIGVTSNFDLQKSEYTLLGEYNPYNFIAGLFENELTLFVY